MRRLERLVLKFYKSVVPNRVKQRLPEAAKVRGLEALYYLTSRPSAADIRARRKAELAERRKDWSDAAHLWQLQALRHQTVPQAPEAIPVAQLPRLQVIQDDHIRKKRFALGRLRLARAQTALALYREGQDRAADELVVRIVESLPDQRILKDEPVLLEAASTYIRKALGPNTSAPLPVQTAHPAMPRKIAICLDVLKLSEVHTHVRVLFAICRNLIEEAPDTEVHLIVTRERFVTTTPNMGISFLPEVDAEIEALARSFMGPLMHTRFHLRQFVSTGLEGCIATCQAIRDLAPDVILYAGGHRGLFSNESRLVRHSLFDHFPTVFIFIQSNNRVDPKLDMIIARGPHRIEGKPGRALIRVQPYPTILKDEMYAPPAIDLRKQSSGVIVSALAGLRMNQRLLRLERRDMMRLLSILDRVPGSVWHMIGSASTESLLEGSPLLARRVARGQVVVHPVLEMEEFTALVSTAALFIHPPGFTGGSGGAAVARAAGIPILTMRDSDVSGRQPGETVFGQDQIPALSDMAVTLLQDPAAWARIVTLQNETRARIAETAAGEFLTCLGEAMGAYRERIAAARS